MPLRPQRSAPQTACAARAGRRLVPCTRRTRTGLRQCLSLQNIGVRNPVRPAARWRAPRRP
eukprot:254151-Lingulodinium_polyedra.AAC.1